MTLVKKTVAGAFEGENAVQEAASQETVESSASQAQPQPAASEAQPSAEVAEKAKAVQAATSELAVAAANNSTALAVKSEFALQLAKKVQGTAKGIADANLFNLLLDVMPVDWDTVPRISTKGGEFVFKEDEKAKLGKSLDMQVMSLQWLWVASPNDTKAPKELLEFSDDGVVSNNGVDLKEHVEYLRSEGYADAAIEKRLVVVGELLATSNVENGAKHIGALFQMSLPVTGTAKFKSHCVQAAFAVTKGKLSIEDSQFMRVQAEDASSSSGEDYTKVVFGFGTGKAPSA